MESRRPGSYPVHFQYTSDFDMLEGGRSWLSGAMKEIGRSSGQNGVGTWRTSIEVSSPPLADRSVQVSHPGTSSKPSRLAVYLSQSEFMVETFSVNASMARISEE